MNWYRVHDLEVMNQDLRYESSGRVNYFQAWEHYKDGWRLPFAEEIIYLLKLSQEYGVLNLDFTQPYWTEENDVEHFRAIVVLEGQLVSANFNDLYRARLVRPITF
jgi:hypothetical protein